MTVVRWKDDRKEYLKEYSKRPEQKEKKKAYQEAHPEQFAEYYRVYRERHPERSLFRAARDRAKKRNLEFNLEYSDIVIPDYCPVLGIKIIPTAGRGTPGGKLNSPSLDRIDNSKGYTKDNVQVISHQANSMKFTATKEELLKFAEWVLETYK